METEKPTMETVEERPGRAVTFENASASEMQPAIRRFMNVKDVMQDLSCSQSYACKVIRKINDELSKRGLMTFRGRVLRRAYMEATGGTAE
ncbi:hypothetical protein [uncultured Selenomonas sp.]|uniref:hypothetical protein n=1 Tax=uncultured Selenomonas sp. TaxID=159275 RepID=UPI0025DE52A9|nr:hypothetical protein [uncultured Selenomonas sp.]